MKKMRFNEIKNAKVEMQEKLKQNCINFFIEIVKIRRLIVPFLLHFKTRMRISSNVRITHLLVSNS